MSKKDLLKKIESLRLGNSITISQIYKRIDSIEEQVAHQAELSQLLTDYLGLTFYEISENKRIEVRKKTTNKKK